MTGPEQYFILIYDIPRRDLEIHEFAGDYEAAAAAYTGFEDTHRSDTSVEVVLVGADSIDTIKTTHSHYFSERADDLFAQFLEAAPADFAETTRVVRRNYSSVKRRGDRRHG